MLVVFGFVSNLVTFIPVTIFTSLSALYGVGRHDDELNDFIKLRALEYQYYWQICIAFTILFARWAIVTTLMGLTKGCRLVPQLWFIFAFSAGVFIWELADDIATCDPIAATWNPALGTCSIDAFLARSSGMFVSSAVSFALDLSCVVIAWRLLQDFDFLKQARWALGVIFVFAIYASIAPLARLHSFDAYADPHENLCRVPLVYPFLGHGAAASLTDKLDDIMIWSNIEAGMALIVISVPSLARISMGYFGEWNGDLDTIEFYQSDRLFAGDAGKLPMNELEATKQGGQPRRPAYFTRNYSF
ncbi:uncharacterized protein PG986_007796 [Apiospora aurea]|uniref:Rhodopsin domain-containing protein n=1 Tax=Apiospora aurea TaxID=335848 RepID=A0ABR1QDW6_9PEZI